MKEAAIVLGRCASRHRYDRGHAVCSCAQRGVAAGLHAPDDGAFPAITSAFSMRKANAIRNGIALK
jgi:hypothetical protein